MNKLVVFAVCVCVGAVAFSDAFAQPDLGFKGVGARIGMVEPEDVDATFGFGVFADLGNITPEIRLEANIDYWSQSEDVIGVGEVRVRDFTIGARGKYLFPMSNPKVKPFAGAGLGLHFVKGEISAPGLPSVDDSETKLGLDLGGGVAAVLNPKTELTGELWYGFVTDVSQLTLRVGLLYRLGR